MRNLFLFLLLISLVTLLEQGQGPLQPVTAAAFLFTGALLASGFAGRIGVSPFVGAIAAGMGLSVFYPSIAGSAHAFGQVAAAWVGFALGGLLAPRAILTRSSALAACALGSGAFLTTFGGALALGLSGQEALSLAIVATAAAPVFSAVGGSETHTGPVRKQTLPLVVSAVAVSLWFLWQALGKEGVVGIVLHSLPWVAVWLLCLEALFRCLTALNTQPGRYLMTGLIALLAWAAALSAGIDTLLFGFVSGLVLSFRAGKRRVPLLALDPPTPAVAGFVTASFAASLNWASLLSVSGTIWAAGALLVLCSLGGKLLGGLVIKNTTDAPFREWSHTLPQGLVGAMLLSSDLGSRHDAGLLPVFVVLASIAVSLPLNRLDVWSLRREVLGKAG